MLQATAFAKLSPQTLLDIRSKNPNKTSESPTKGQRINAFVWHHHHPSSAEHNFPVNPSRSSYRLFQPDSEEQGPANPLLAAALYSVSG